MELLWFIKKRFEMVGEKILILKLKRFVSVKFQPNKKVKLGLEYTHMDYLAKQPGGLDDISFELNPDTSFRSRNWFPG